MAGSQTRVKALYDFSGEPNTAELTISAGDILQVTNKNVGEGWWEGINHHGVTGLFPEAYVEEITSQPPAMPPPPLPKDFQEPPAADWNQDPWSAPPQQQPQQQHQHAYSAPEDQQARAVSGFARTVSVTSGMRNKTYDAGDDWDDEWDDDSEAGGAVAERNTLNVPGQMQRAGSTGDINTSGKTAPVRRNLNRFSTFVKSGGENYILGTLRVAIPDGSTVQVLETQTGVQWSPAEPYTCVITSPKKETKLKGLKSFIAYQLTPSFNNIQVSRRYKHFDWLHERLEEKFSLIPIPPLPDKQISGRYEEHFIERRKAQLQMFIDHMCRHPILSQCDVWKHFLMCTDDKRWKQGKRRAEKDELLGANFFLVIEAPERPLELARIEQQTENFGKYVHELDNSVRNMQITINDQVKKFVGPTKRDFQKIGQSFRSIGLAFESDPDTTPQNLITALKITGATYDDIGKLYEDQPKLDWDPFGDVMHAYKGLLSSFPDILNVHKSAIHKRRECEKLVTDPKQVADVGRRSDVVSYALFAEVNHFHQRRVNDFRSAMQEFLSQQVKFYQEIVTKLQYSLEQYDKV